MFRYTVALAVVLFMTLSVNCIANEVADEEQSLEDRVAALENNLKLALGSIKNIREGTPSLTSELNCQESGYSIVMAAGRQFGFLVDCVDVIPYLEGHKLKLRIRNPYYANFDQVSLTIYYGIDAVEALLEQKRISTVVEGSLKGGAWNHFEVAINPSKPEELRYLSFGIGVSSTLLDVIKEE